jgi:methylmalonyl-CoA mutase cobalamin-binding domain/chain
MVVPQGRKPVPEINLSSNRALHSGGGALDGPKRPGRRACPLLRTPEHHHPARRWRTSSCRHSRILHFFCAYSISYTKDEYVVKYFKLATNERKPHDRGVKIVARTLRDAGMDVVYTGLHRSPDEVVAAAVQEDVDVLGISLLSGAHMTIFPKVIAGLKARGVDDMILVDGGVMPDEDVTALKSTGVHEVLLQDMPRS